MPVRIEDLISGIKPVDPHMPATDLLWRFQADADCRAIPVVFGRTAIGIVTRDDVMFQAFTTGQSGLAACTVSTFLFRTFPAAEYGTALGRVAMDIRATDTKGLVGVTVTRNGAFEGFVPADAMFAALARENASRATQMRAARQNISRLHTDLADQRKAAAARLSRLAHEVRTPLTAMVGHADKLLTGNATSEMRDSLGVIAHTGEALSALVTRTVEAGKSETDAKAAIETGAFSLRRMVDDTACLWSTYAHQKQLTLTTDIARGSYDRIESDAGLIRQIVDNLMSNAIKYTERGSVALYSAITGEGDDLRLELIVEDSGPGVSAQEQDKLFRPFSRLKSAGENEGAGLGLHISQLLAERLNATLVYRPRDRGGSRFELSLPVRAAVPRLAAQGKAQRRPRAALQLGDILLVEDHAASQALISSALTSAGWGVDTVATLSQARRRAMHKRYQLVLCDYFLRDGEGDILLRDLRRNDGPNRNTPCLAVTADASSERRQHCLSVGFAGVITKPLRAAQLVTTLIDFINDARTDIGDDRVRA